ncbi:hypothetical protein GGS23DRAFT_547556 [Durotheca rogersii]|uniref:uncharacterized protein n=1 Tax=Durotheca rogersii TaxID=419775 RepID=UPI002220098A|nr:uncharacterized protein GGS23DRAFT_547556 [Durotheca rogersii]KAI5867264.1 hypothetical protein GGS23DRAFT_547556 [Durotheca rogersii]
MYLALLWQALGGAVAMPLYFGMHIRWTCKQRVTKVADPHQARALATAFWLGAVVPMLCLMAPTWQGQASRSPATQQGIVAFFQPTPLYASGIMMAMTRVSTHLAGGLGSTTETRKEQALAGRWIRRLYLAAAALAAIGHLYVVGRAFQAADGGIVTLTRMYVPSPFPGPAGVGEVLVRGPWLFLQWDGIIIALASLSWGVILLKQALPAGEATTITVILASLVGAVVLGPGPTVTLALYVREGYLQEGSEERTQRGN